MGSVKFMDPNLNNKRVFEFPRQDQLYEECKWDFKSKFSKLSSGKINEAQEKLRGQGRRISWMTQRFEDSTNFE